MSVQIRASIIVTAPDDETADAILLELAAHHDPLRETFVTIYEKSREFIPEARVSG